MIYRKWSLLTGPVTIVGGIVGAIIVSTYAFVENDNVYEKVKGLEPLYQIGPFVKQEQKKSDASSTK